jgi:hypothetical protein
VEDEPVCEDFEVGASHAKLKGGLRKPVRVRLLEDADDDDAISSRILLGKRTPSDPAPMLSVPDDDDVLVVEWAQCENERAPRPVRTDARDQSEVAAYECGTAKVYAKTELKVVEGDAASRVVRFVAPPEPACWTNQAPPEAAAAATATATAEAAASPATEPTATAATSASVAPAESARPAAPPDTAAPKAAKSSK